MEQEIKKITLSRVMIIISVIIAALLLVARVLYSVGIKEIDKQVAKIHATKLTLDDVTGKRLPPDPGAEADKTIQGVDTNQNGIRDDVELAIFKEYPNSTKTRAVLLQYALVLQMEMMQPVVNGSIVGEVANKQDRSIFCMAKIIAGGGEGSVLVAIGKYGEFISSRQFNTETRKNAHKDFYKQLKSGRIDDSIPCDIELNSLSD